MKITVLAEALVHLHKQGLIKNLLDSSTFLETCFKLKPRELDNEIDYVIMRRVV